MTHIQRQGLNKVYTCLRSVVVSHELRHGVVLDNLSCILRLSKLRLRLQLLLDSLPRASVGR